jgi:hypothetical protein
MWEALTLQFCTAAAAAASGDISLGLITPLLVTQLSCKLYCEVHCFRETGDWQFPGSLELLQLCTAFVKHI